jgi:hypothetical protein
LDAELQGLKAELKPGGEVPPLARVYRDCLDVDFDANYEPATNETPSKKPQKRYETTVEEIQPGLSPARITWRLAVPE